MGLALREEENARQNEKNSNIFHFSKGLKIGNSLGASGKKWNEKNMEIFGKDLSFIDIREKERTKHVHRLHPYLGKFIPQLVETFLKKYFKEGDWILDPFAGSGTTLIEANALGMNSVGIELSQFNHLITKYKTTKYNIPFLENEILDILAKVRAYREFLNTSKSKLFSGVKYPKLTTKSKYLNEWIAPKSLKQILYFNYLIDNYAHKNILKIILSRATRSARLIPHYDLARPNKPIKTPYWCIKHNRTCEPLQDCFKFIERYCLDTIERIKEFDRLRTNKKMVIFHGDARKYRLNNKYKFDGIFTSPPYVGLIDYHDQHKYAYELFGFHNNEKNEIGPMSGGRNAEAKRKYKNDLIKVFQNVAPYLKRNAKIFVVVNDKDLIYPQIAKECGLEIVDVFHRPVLMRTERDNYKFSESIYYFKKIK